MAGSTADLCWKEITTHKLPNKTHLKVVCIYCQIHEISLCTSTRWSLGTWQLLLIFYWDHVNRLPEQTQRRTYGYALLALRWVGAKKKFFVRRVSLNKASETRLICFNIRSTYSNHDFIYFSVPFPLIQYRRAILYNTYIIYTRL